MTYRYDNNLASKYGVKRTKQGVGLTIILAILIWLKKTYWDDIGK